MHVSYPGEAHSRWWMHMGAQKLDLKGAQHCVVVCLQSLCGQIKARLYLRPPSLLGSFLCLSLLPSLPCFWQHSLNMARAAESLSQALHQEKPVWDTRKWWRWKLINDWKIKPPNCYPSEEWELENIVWEQMMQWNWGQTPSSSCPALNENPNSSKCVCTCCP